jgi:hypothetical protein
MGELGEFLIGLPAPFGAIVTGVARLVAIGGGIGSAVAYRQDRRGLAVALGIVSAVGIAMAAAFLSVT